MPDTQMSGCVHQHCPIVPVRGEAQPKDISFMALGDSGTKTFSSNIFLCVGGCGSLAGK